MVKYKSLHNQKGVSLLEVLMVVGIMTLLVTGAAQIFDDWFKQSVNRTVASEMLELQNAAEQYVKLNMDTVVDTMVPVVGNTAELDIDTLKNRDFISEDYRARNSFGQSLRVLLRNAGTNTVGGTAIEVVTVSDDDGARDARMQDKRLFDAALSGGPRLGLISDVDLGPNCCTGNIQSAYGEWSVPLSQFAGLYTRTPDIERGGYMAAYGRVSLNDDVNDRYLYRVEVTDKPELNRMMVNMDMNSLDIVNAGTVVSDNMAVGGNATLNGRETTGFSSPYVIAVSDNFDGGGNMIITADGDSKGDLIVVGDDNTSTFDLNVTNNATLQGANGQALTKRANVTSVQNMGSGAFETMNVQAGAFNVQRVTATNTQIVGNANQVSFLQTAGARVRNVTAENAVTAVTEVTGNNMTVNNNLTSNNNLAVQGNLNATNVRGSTIVKIDDLTGCANGCP